MAIQKIITGIFEYLVRRFGSTLQYRAIAAHVSTVRRVSTRQLSRVTRHETTVYNKMEMDSHADTVVLGRNCTILSYTGRGRVRRVALHGFV